MDSCVICGIKRSPDVRLTKIKGGWVCGKCIKKSTLMEEFPLFSDRSKALKGMTVSEMRESYEKGVAKAEKLAAEREAAERRRTEEAEARKAGDDIRMAKWMNRDAFPVTTLDINRPYQIIGPVFFQTSNRKGMYESNYSKLYNKYYEEISARHDAGLFSPVMEGVEAINTDMLIGGGFDRHLDPGFYICVEELKRIAIQMDADAIVGFKFDFNLDFDKVQRFYLQCYGTAIKFITDEDGAVATLH